MRNWKYSVGLTIVIKNCYDIYCEKLKRKGKREIKCRKAVTENKQHLCPMKGV